MFQLHTQRQSSNRGFTIIESLMMLLAIAVFTVIAYSMLKRDGKIPWHKPEVDETAIVTPPPAPKAAEPKAPSVEPPKMPLILPKGDPKAADTKTKPAGS